MPAKSAKKKSIIFRQICELIPGHMLPSIGRKYGVKSRAITPWSHVVSLLYAQFTHAIGLNDVCDALRANRSAIASIRGAKPPSRNGLSHANKTRNPEMAKDLFWSVMKYLEQLHRLSQENAAYHCDGRGQRRGHRDGVLQQQRHLIDYLRLYGTAGGSFRLQWSPQQAFLPGFT